MMFLAAKWNTTDASPTSWFTNVSSSTEPITSWAVVGTVSALPVNRSSRTVTRAPAPTSRRTSAPPTKPAPRSEEHTSELQSHVNLVCRLLLEKKKKKQKTQYEINKQSYGS